MCTLNVCVSAIACGQNNETSFSPGVGAEIPLCELVCLTSERDSKIQDAFSRSDEVPLSSSLFSPWKHLCRTHLGNTSAELKLLGRGSRRAAVAARGQGWALPGGWQLSPGTAVGEGGSCSCLTWRGRAERWPRGAARCVSLAGTHSNWQQAQGNRVVVIFR